MGRGLSAWSPCFTYELSFASAVTTELPSILLEDPWPREKCLEGHAPTVFLGLSVLLNNDYRLFKSQLRDMAANQSVCAYVASL